MGSAVRRRRLPSLAPTYITTTAAVNLQKSTVRSLIDIILRRSVVVGVYSNILRRGWFLEKVSGVERNYAGRRRDGK